MTKSKKNVSAVVAAEKATESKDSDRYLTMWKKNPEGKWRPVTHRFEVVDNCFEIVIEKNSKFDTTKINISYVSKDGPMEFEVGSNVKQLGRVWVGAPKSIKDKNKDVCIH